MDINELRCEIDSIDKNLVELFKNRMSIAADVAEYKRQNNMKVLDASRERALLQKVSDLAGEELEEYTRILYATILDISRSYQHKRLGIATELKNIFDSALQKSLLNFRCHSYCLYSHY